MPRSKRFKVAPSVTEKSSATMPPTHSNDRPILPTQDGARLGQPLNHNTHTVPPTNSGAHSMPPAHSDARSVPTSKGGVHSLQQTDSRARLEAPTNSGARLVPQTSIGTCSHSLPPTHSRSSAILSHHSPNLEAEDIDSFDEYVDNLFSTSGDTGSSSRKNNNYWIVNVIGKNFVPFIFLI